MLDDNQEHNHDDYAMTTQMSKLDNRTCCSFMSSGLSSVVVSSVIIKIFF
jgi:hypothetical protein